ncbi:hypothetical protein PIB30_079213 [Stylosanthes scabra]|uniref:Uncharacterized protein n=1 Tax=Stylosanthes scabra TaxID=79078 RepID=A0ABU6SRR2_9FABA|nr:hypothetical protein [Stylosanthes scabra]
MTQFFGSFSDSNLKRGPCSAWPRFNENAYRFPLTDNMIDVELPDYLGRKFMMRPETVFWFINNAENAFPIHIKKHHGRVWLDAHDLRVVMRCCKPERNSMMSIEYLN